MSIKDTIVEKINGVIDGIVGLVNGFIEKTLGVVGDSIKKILNLIIGFVCAGGTILIVGLVILVVAGAVQSTLNIQILQTILDYISSLIK